MTAETKYPEPPAMLESVRLEADKAWKDGKLSPLHKRLPTEKRWPQLRSLAQSRGIRYAGCTFENFHTTTKQRDTVNRLRKFAADMPERMTWGGGVVLLGPPGTGKDHLLMALMRSAIMDHGFTVQWHDGLRMFHRIKAAINDHSTEQMLKEMVSVQILALSDPVPPRDELTAYELSVLRDIVERRYSRLLPTWITTNVQTPGDARKLFSTAVLDRLLHGAHEEFMNWPSYRTEGT